MRSTLADIARESGVSKATVDRVLNRRARVHDRTRDAVLQTAVRLGYIVNGSDVPVSAPLEVARLDFVLPQGSNRFMQMLQKELVEQSALHKDLDVKFHLVDGFDPEIFANKLKSLKSVTRGIGMVAVDHPAIREAVRFLVRAGVKVVTLVSDILHVPREGYIGIDNRSAGRLIGFLTSQFLGPGKHKVALFAGSIAYRGHEEREMGFRQIVKELPGRLEIVEFSEVHDDDNLSFAAAIEHLGKHPDLSAIYCIGAGKRGIARALAQTGRGSEVVFMGHDLTDYTKALLFSGIMEAIIDQNPHIEAREALAQLSRAVRGQTWNARPVRTQIICKENIPEELE